jgi:hypothetical protein
MSNKKLSIFMSYSQKDSEVALGLAQVLRKKGLSIWIASESIRPGAKWIEEIERGLREADVFLLLISPDSLSSPWANVETGAAVSRAAESPNVLLVPVLVRGVDAKSLPILLRRWQYLDATRMGVEEIGDKLSTILSEVKKDDANLTDTQTVPQVAATVAWLWSFIAPGTTAFTENVAKGLGEGFAKAAWNLIAKAREIDPEQAIQVDQSPVAHQDIAKSLIMRVLQNNPAEAQQIKDKVVVALRNLLREPSLFTDQDIRHYIAPNLGYRPEYFGGPLMTRAMLTNALLEHAIADGKLEDLIHEIQRRKPHLFA